MKKLFVLTVFSLCVVLNAPMALAFQPSEATAETSQREELEKLFDDYYRYNLEQFPTSATSLGIREYNDRLTDVSPEAYARRAEQDKIFLNRLEAIDISVVEGEPKVSAEILRFILTNRVRQAPFRSWRRPFLADSGFHSNIVRTMTSAPMQTKADYENYLSRLKALPRYLDQNLDNMRTGLADGFTQPKEILPFVLPSFEAQAVDDPEAHGLYRPFEDMPSRISSGDQKRFRKRARALIANEILPRYAQILAFFRDEYMPGAAETVGVSDLPDGAEYYAAQIKFYTTLEDMSADDIHQIGLAEVARIRGEMNAIIQEVDFDGSFKEFQEFLRTDDQFYAPTAQELLKEAAFISKEVDGKLPAFFGKLPRQPYSVEPVPAEIAPNYTTGRYVGAALNAARGGQYWVNTYNLKTRPLYELKALSLHEAVPGHHLQIALSLEIEDVPSFRKGFYPHAYGEGWGLYAEALGKEMGIYKTPYDHFGRLSYEMWRACRLVIDTGLHSIGWTRQQALDYLADNTALSLHNVQTEVDRYIAWPGQALAYKMGELKIWELRRRAEEALGEDFDIRAFHDAVLVSGGVPLGLLERRIDDFITSEKAKADD
ncbi:MAG: DUF885 domain-containing protein [Pseudomonadota bacterium]